jgi:hypothetical protein
MGFDNTAWESTLYEFADSDYDVIIVGTYQMQELLAKVAPEYPDKGSSSSIQRWQLTTFIPSPSSRMKLPILQELSPP